MPDFDATASAALDEVAIAPAWFIFIDFDGDPLFATTYGRDVTFAGTGDADLDGNTFAAFDGRVVSFGDISYSDNGSDTFTLELSGLPVLDADLMAAIADTTTWRGRSVRIWLRVFEETGSTEQGAIVAFKTGYATSVKIIPGLTQRIILEVENYLAAFNQASNRNYLNQTDYDAADESAAATLAAANMGRGVGGAKGRGGGGGSGGFGGIAGGILMNHV